MAHTASCICGNDFRFIACHLVTGLPKAILHPVSADFQITLNEVGTGTVTLSAHDVDIRQVWPHATAIYITRVNGPLTGSSEDPYAEFAGIIETASADGGGTLSLGLVSIEKYLDFRIIKEAAYYDQVSQTQIAKRLADLAKPRGIATLTAVAAASTVKRDRTYSEYDDKIIGEAIRELTQVEDGPDYELVHQRIPYEPTATALVADVEGQRLGAGEDTGQGFVWQTQIIFRDHVGADRGLRFTSDVNALGYSLDIDAATQANWVRGVGGGEGIARLTSEQEDLALYPALYPEYDAAPSYTDVTLQGTLDEQTAGYLADYTEPVATPGVTIKGLDPDPSTVKVGDTIMVDTNFGAVTFVGSAWIKSISWNLADGEPVSRDLELVPTEPPSESVYGQRGKSNCEEC